MTESEARSRPETLTVRPIGYVQSEYGAPRDVWHHRADRDDAVSVLRLDERNRRLLRGLQGYSHIIVLFWVHRAGEWKMPKGHSKPKHIKVFATRMPVRPNPIGLSLVELLDFSTETGEVKVRGLDAVDGSPVLDIKPYLPHCDSLPEATVPDWVTEGLNRHFHGEAGPSKESPDDHSHPGGSREDHHPANGKNDPRRAEAGNLQDSRIEQGEETHDAANTDRKPGACIGDERRTERSGGVRDVYAHDPPG